MKNTIGKKILTVIFIPFLIIFGVLSLYIAYTITVYVTSWIELEIKGISEINAVDLSGRVYSVEMSVKSAADSLDVLDPQSENVREQADSIIKSMFNNSYIYNSWLAYEPDALDGRDSENTSDYPGAPSGRFIRSYLLEDGSVMVAPDMDEQTLDNPDESPWYVIPRDTDRFYVDVNNDIPNLYDYGTGEEPVYTLSLVAPLHDEDGRVIGCVGADVLFEDMTIGLVGGKQAAVAVLYPNGRIFYSERLEYAEESVHTMQFKQPELIMDAVSTAKSLFLPDEYSIFLKENAFSYFQPVNITDQEGGSLCLYVAISRSEAFAELRPVFILIAAILAAAIAVVTVMYLYISGRISKPIRKLTLAADAISQGDLEAEIASFSDSDDEIGMMSRSLYRMVEQFRVYIIQLRQAQEEMAAYSQIGSFIKEFKNAGGVFGRVCAMLSRQMGFYKAAAIHTNAGRTTVAARFESGSGLPETVDSQDFIYHPQIRALLSGKKLLFFNSSAISENKLEFLSEDTMSACILPLWADNILYGYFILENKDKDLSFGSGNEALLIYIAGTIADWLSRTDAITEEQAAPEVNSLTLRPAPVKSGFSGGADGEDVPAPVSVTLSRLRDIDGLDVDEALEAMGGLGVIYEQSVALFIRLLPETAEKLDETAADDLNAFVIEIHGLKGSLNNIGATGLGLEASEIEKAAKALDSKLCGEKYPPFRERLMEFYESLKSAVDIPDAKVREAGDNEILAETIEKVFAATQSYDALDALDLLRPLMDFTYGEETDAQLAAAAAALEIFDFEKALVIISRL